MPHLITFATVNTADGQPVKPLTMQKPLLIGVAETYDLIVKAQQLLTFDGNQKKLAEAEGLVVPVLTVAKVLRCGMEVNEFHANGKIPIKKE